MDSIAQFWQDFKNGLSGGWVGGQLSTAQAAGNDQARAMGFDPVTGTFISPAYADTFSKLHPGQDVGTVINGQRQQAGEDYLSGFNSAFDANGGISLIPFSPVIGGDASILPGLGLQNNFSSVLVIGFVLVLGFFLLKAVK